MFPILRSLVGLEVSDPVNSFFEHKDDIGNRVSKQGGLVTSITIQCPDEVLISLKDDAESFGRDLTLAAAMKFYELRRLSSGRAADLAGIPRAEFLRRAADYKVAAWDLSQKELMEDFGNA